MGKWIIIGVIFLAVLIGGGIYISTREEEKPGFGIVVVDPSELPGANEGTGNEEINGGIDGQDESGGNGDEEYSEEGGSGFWKNFELEDVNSGEKFRISDFSGTPVLLESFAVWCPTCTKQQNEIKALHDEIGDEFISISIDPDPNEDAEKVVKHTEKHGFDWRYAISPSELTIALKDEFGLKIVNAPSVPVVLICGDGSFRLLSSSRVKKVDELKTEIATCG